MNLALYVAVPVAFGLVALASFAVGYRAGRTNCQAAHRDAARWPR